MVISTPPRHQLELSKLSNSQKLMAQVLAVVLLISMSTISTPTRSWASEIENSDNPDSYKQLLETQQTQTGSIAGDIELHVMEHVMQTDIDDIVALDARIVGIGTNGDSLFTLYTNSERCPLDDNEELNAYLSQKGYDYQCYFMDSPITTMQSDTELDNSENIMAQAGAISDGKNFIGGGPLRLKPPIGTKYTCSLGFPAYNGSNARVLITAGHCTTHGDTLNSNVSIFGLNPQNSPAATNSSTPEDDIGSGSDDIADLDTSVYGYVGQTTGETAAKSMCEAPNSIYNCYSDIAVYTANANAASWKYFPQVTQWDNQVKTNNNLLNTAVEISEIRLPKKDDTICQSGRTTGWTCGIVIDTSAILCVGAVQNHICSQSPGDLGAGRWVQGFTTSVHTDHGDSGGTFVQQNGDGTWAGIGTLTGGSSELSLGVSITEGLDVLTRNSLGNYPYRIQIVAPKVVGCDDSISKVGGSAAPNATVHVQPIPSGAPFTVTANDYGIWEFPYASLGGATQFKLRQSNTYSLSENSSTYSLPNVGQQHTPSCEDVNKLGQWPNCYSPPPPPPPTSSITRLHNPISGEHHYTKDDNEIMTLVTEWGWRDEGVGWTTLNSGTPVYRLFNPISGEHHYTKNDNEIRTLVKEWGWVNEGVGWTTLNSGTPVYRLFNPISGEHHYTKNDNEIRTLVTEWGWVNENIGWWSVY
jgi:hypothetical protein